MSDTNFTTEPKALPPPRRLSRRAIGAGALIGVLLAGAALGAGGTKLAQNWQPQSVMLLQPAPINQLRDESVVAVKGQVADIYGNKFVVEDGSGRALVDTGPRGESRLVAVKGEAITVQGRFDRGMIRAEIITHADGRSEAFGPPRGPKGPKEGPKGPKGPKGGPMEGPDVRADRGPPPPPGAPDRDDDDAPPPPR
jgi:hypothetical protein